MNEHELIAMIERAFQHVPYPGDHSLTDSTYGAEPEALVRDFAGKTDWRVLDGAFLDQAPEGWATALSFFSGEALQFYVPAYMIADIRGELLSADPAHRLAWCVTAEADAHRIAEVWGGGTIASRNRADYDAFDAAQAAAISAYLRWKAATAPEEAEMIEAALAQYWLKRAGPTES